MTQDPAISAEYLATTPLPSTTWGPVDIHAPGAVAELHRRIAETQEALRVRVELLLSLNVGRDDSLLDAEGYPRSDICVHTVRLARSQADMLHNDLHQLTHQAQQAVEAAFSRPAEERGDLAGWSSTAGSTPGSTAGAQRPSSSSPAGGSASNVGQRLSAPVGGLPATAPTDVLDGAFATVNVVIPHSPAHEAVRQVDSRSACACICPPPPLLIIVPAVLVSVGFVLVAAARTRARARTHKYPGPSRGGCALSLAGRGSAPRLFIQRGSRAQLPHVR
ncbi:hypothetical protein, variant [Fonticula alba]|uniref:Nas2 N-terminal domain-containing protein n=1 Tax=Fonticula alba TaxID=691883 RepID=A0A058Z3W7_FONAL|nr:hypothetical protein, variant [Fonticula alba]KCV68227.1 hypothetical protein, variant [Fonticula alba]|eukprot:XP_009497281.1 hypothetical protein, variant [Fonticula alba]